MNTKEMNDKVCEMNDHTFINKKDRSCPCGKHNRMLVEIDGKIQDNINALDFLKFALDVKTGKRKPLKEGTK